MSEIYTENNTQTNEFFETFIQNNKDSGESPLSPRNYDIYCESLMKIKKFKNGSHISFAAEGFTTLVLYKNKNGIFMFHIFLDNKICSYYMICENESNQLDESNQFDESNQLDELNEFDELNEANQIKELESFIKNNDESYAEPFSPKLRGIYNKMYSEIVTENPFSYRTIGNDGMRTLLLYKNKNAIYFVEVYMDTIASYYTLQEIQ